MPEHRQGAPGPDLLPLWVQLVWVGVLAAIVAGHSVHVLTMGGQARAWHATHLLMGVGMLYMVTPWVGVPGSTRAWQYLFAAAALGVIGWTARELQGGRAVNLLWLLSGIGLAAMAYMFLLHRGHGVREVTFAFVAYHLAETAAWAHGWFAESADRRASIVPYALGGAGAPALARSSGAVAAAQAAMALVMAYMFLAMDADATAFVDKAFGTGAITEQTLWACSLLAVVLLACLPAPKSSGTDPSEQDHQANATRTRPPTAAG